jgi:hypothetical protein
MDCKIIIIMIQRDDFCAFVLSLDYTKMISIAYPTRKSEKEFRFLTGTGTYMYVYMSHVVPVPTARTNKTNNNPITPFSL